MFWELSETSVLQLFLQTVLRVKGCTWAHIHGNAHTRTHTSITWAILGEVFWERKSNNHFFFTGVNLKIILTHCKVVKRAFFEVEDSQKGFGLDYTGPLLILLMFISAFCHIC